MPHDQVAAELYALLERAGVDPREVTPQTPLSALYLDSLDHQEIKAALLDRFGVVVEPTELLASGTVGAATQLIDRKVEARA